MDKTIAVSQLVEHFGGVQEAADALGCDRATLWRWSTKTHFGVIPQHWAYKASALMRRKPRQTAPNRSGGKQ
jgi:hypothetical protein